MDRTGVSWQSWEQKNFAVNLLMLDLSEPSQIHCSFLTLMGNELTGKLILLNGSEFEGMPSFPCLLCSLCCANSLTKRNLQGIRVRGRLRNWNCNPAVIGGKAALDYIRARICPRGLCLSRLLLTSETLIDSLNGKILWALGSFFLRPSSDK